MSRYDDYSPFPEYIPVDVRKHNNEEMAKKLAEENSNTHPIILTGRAITNTFWGKAWCKNVESYRDYENRLPRGRSYIRNNAVLDLQISKGKITSLVASSYGDPYEITIQIEPLQPRRWESIKQACTGKIQSLLDIIRGKLSKEILELFCDKEKGLFPEPKEIKMECSCPDIAHLCKHLAATLYGVGVRLDEDPKLFFTLRGIDEKELVGEGMVSEITEGTPAEIAPEAIGDIFGIELDSTESAKKTTAEAPKAAPTKAKKTTAFPLRKKKKKETLPTVTANFIRDLRNKLHYSPIEFARACKCTSESIKKWEAGATPTAASCKKILAAYKKFKDGKIKPIKYFRK